MISKDKHYRTRDGREVRIYATDGFGIQCVHGAYRDNNGDWAMWLWGINGEATCLSREGEDDRDLIEVKTRHKRTVWLNVYEDDIIGPFVSRSHAAFEMWEKPRIACIKVDLDFEEGEGL